jgi:hypothetical protein
MKRVTLPRLLSGAPRTLLPPLSLLTLFLVFLGSGVLVGCESKKTPVVRSKPPEVVANVVFRPTFHMEASPDIKGLVGFTGAREKGENYFFTPLHSFGPKNNFFTQLAPATITRLLETATLYSMDNKTVMGTAGKSVLNVGRPINSEGNCAYDVVALQMPPDAVNLPLAHTDVRPNTQVWLYGNLHSAVVRSVEPEALTVILERTKKPLSLKKMNGTPLVNKYGEVVGMLNTYVDDGEEVVLLATPVSAMRLLFETNLEAKKQIEEYRNQNPFDTSL